MKIGLCVARNSNNNKNTEANFTVTLFISDYLTIGSVFQYICGAFVECIYRNVLNISIRMSTTTACAGRVFGARGRRAYRIKNSSKSIYTLQCSRLNQKHEPIMQRACIYKAYEYMYIIYMHICAYTDYVYLRII